MSPRRALLPWLGLLAGCLAPPAPPDAGTPAEYAVHVRAAGLAGVELHWFDGVAWAAGPVPLSEDGGWWSGAFTGLPGAQFSLRANGDWYPAGTTTYHPATGDTWLADGLLFPYEPTAGPEPQDQLTVLTVNLHTYQEADALTKLGWVAEVIARGQVDLVAFQECAQLRTAPVVEMRYGVNLRSDNMARLVVADLAARFAQPYDFFWSWSHYGFASYEEGAAVLGRSGYTFLGHQARYISASTSTGSIDSRTALLGAFDVPGLGRVHLFSTHVSWGGPQADQLAALVGFAGEAADAGPVLTVLAGDYNLDYDTDGYRQLVAGGAWADAALEAAPGSAREPTLGQERIDYQFRAAGSRLVPILAQRVFLQLAAPEAANQRVSDHLGVLVHYRLRR